MIIVSNSSPLISLSAIGLFDLLNPVFEKVIIPEEVYEEVVIRGQGLAGSQEVRAATWIIRRMIADKQEVARLMATTKLQRGESEAIILAVELQAAGILLDERVARRQAEARNLRVVGTLGILQLAKSQNLIASVRPHLDALKAAGIRISPAIYHEALRRAGE